LDPAWPGKGLDGRPPPLWQMASIRFQGRGLGRASKTKEQQMSKRKSPPTTEPFRRSQVVSPVPSGRRFGKSKFEKKTFDIYISDIETGDETLATTVYAPTQREAIQIARKRLRSSPLLRRITYAAFTAVEVEQ
jgi:hypothetical protein